MGTSESGFIKAQRSGDEPDARTEIVHASSLFAERLSEAIPRLERAKAAEKDVRSVRGMAGFCELMVAEEATSFAPEAFADLSVAYVEVGNLLGELGRHDLAADAPGAARIIGELCVLFNRAAELAELHVRFGGA